MFLILQVKRHVNDVYMELKEKIALEIKDSFKFSGIAMCIDLWQDKLRKIHYLGATCHYFTKNNDTQKLQLQSRVLNLRALDADLPKEADLLYDALAEMLVEYDIYVHIDDITFVTDRGANIVNSLDGHKHHSCLNHYINNVVKAASEPISGIKKDVNRVIKYMKCSGKNVALTSTLNSFVPTRWNSFYSTLKSLITVFQEIEPLINPKRNDIKRLFRSLNIAELTAICSFLEQFYSLTLELETDTDVTATKILPAHEVLMKHIQSQTIDNSTVRKMKLAAQKYTSDQNVMPPNAVVWTFFDPKFKRMQNFYQTQVIQADAVRKLQVQLEVREINVIDAGNCSCTQSESSHSNEFSSVFDDFEDKSSTNSALTISDEINIYIQMPYKKESSILEFWEKNSHQFPRLYNYFLSFAAIPAASSAVERMFSISSCILTNKRSRIDSQVLNMLTFLNKNHE